MKPANPIIWAAWGGIIGACIGAVASISGHPMQQDILACGMGGLFWAWVVANVKNHLAHH